MKRAKTTTPKTKTKKAAAPKKAKLVVKKPAELQDFVFESLDADKAKDIVTLDLKGKTSITDFMLIATGTSTRHVIGMAQKLRDRLSVEYKIKARLEGLDSGDWVILDAGDVMVHLFREEVRDFYDLEKLWGADFSTVNYTRYQSV